MEVEDTITLNVVSFDVEIFIGTAGQSKGMRKDGSLSDELTRNFKKVEHELRSKKYTYKSDNAIMLYPPLSASSGSTISVRLISEKEADELNELLKQFDFVHSTVKNFKFKDETKAEAMLYKKLLEKGRTKANVIATASGIKAGNIIAVKEVKRVGDFDLNIGDTYFVAEDSKKLHLQDGKLRGGSLYKKLVVRFAAE